MPKQTLLLEPFYRLIMGNGIRGPAQAFGNLVRTIIFPVKRLRINSVVNQTREHGSRHGSRVPICGLKRNGGKLGSRLGNLGGIL